MDLVSAIGASIGGAAAPNASGWEGAGQGIARLFGGGVRPDAYAAGASKGLDIQTKMLEARKLRDESMSRDALREKAASAFPDMPIAQVDAMIAATLGGVGSDFNQSIQGMGHYQTQGLRRQAAGESDPVVQNQILAALDGKPRDLTKISGETAYNPTVAPGAQDLGITAVGEANLANRTAVSGSQIFRNQATGSAALSRAGTYAGSVGARGPGGKLTQLEVEAGKRIMANVDDQYAARIESAKDPTERTRLETERDARLRAIATNGDMSGGRTTVVDTQTGGTVGESVRRALRPGQGRKGAANVYRPQSEADYNAIPKGATFIDPDDGRTYRKD